jgi:hypothetical protein
LSQVFASGSSPEEKLLSSIDRGIDAFGPSVKSVLYYRFSSIYNSERKDILKKPQLFTESLRNFFGDRSFHVEESIVASIIDAFHLSEVNYADSLTRVVHEAVKQNRV